MAADYRPPITAGTQAAIDAEASTRASADTALAGTVTAEATARANADSAEVTARTNAIAAAIAGPTADIAAETTARIAADATLTTAVGLKASSAALASETSSRASADTALDGRLSTVESSSATGLPSKLSIASNLSDVANTGTSRANLRVPVLLPAACVATANVALTGLQTIDGYTTVDGDQALLTAQTTASQNGPWVAHSGAWTRPTDFPSGAVLKARTITIIGGTVHAKETWLLQTNTSVTVDTTAQTWVLAASGSGSGLPASVRTVTANDTAAAGDFILANAAGGPFTETLPAAPATGALVTVKKVDGTANPVLVAPSGGGTVDGDATGASISSPQFGAVFEHTGSNVWKIVAITSSGGSNGVDGRTILSTTGAPSAGVGVNGDYAIDAAGVLYGPKAAGSWPGGVSLIGPAGSNGLVTQIKDEGLNVTTRAAWDFVGPGVTVTDGTTKNIITIPGSQGRTFVSGKYYSGDSVGQSSNVTLGNNTESAIRFPVGASTLFDRIGVNVSTAVAATVGRLGIRLDDGPGPGTLLLEATGTIDMSTTGDKTLVIAQTLAPGIYWLTVTAQGGGPGILGLGVQPNGSIGRNDMTLAYPSYYALGGVTGALPAAWGATKTTANNVPTPNVCLRAA